MDFLSIRRQKMKSKHPSSSNLQCLPKVMPVNSFLCFFAEKVVSISIYSHISFLMYVNGIIPNMLGTIFHLIIYLGEYFYLHIQIFNSLMVSHCVATPQVSKQSPIRESLLFATLCSCNHAITFLYIRISSFKKF